MQPTHACEVRPRKDKRGVDLISDALPSAACGTASQTHSATQSATRSIAAGHMMALIRIYDDRGNLIEMHAHRGDFREF